TLRRALRQPALQTLPPLLRQPHLRGALVHEPPQNLALQRRTPIQPLQPHALLKLPLLRRRPDLRHRLGGQQQGARHCQPCQSHDSSSASRDSSSSTLSPLNTGAVRRIGSDTCGQPNVTSSTGGLSAAPPGNTPFCIS